MSNIVKSERVGLVQIGSYKEALHFAETVAKSNFVPKAFQGRPGDVMVAMQWGAEIGLKPLQALQNIAVINGRPGMYGDAALALIQGSGMLEDIEETVIDGVATCRVKRLNRKTETVRSFSEADAKSANLWGKQGPWKQYPERMLQMRARGFALRDAFPDVLMGLGVAEELEDILIEPGKKEQAAQISPSQPEIENVTEAEIVELPDLASGEQLEMIEELSKMLGMTGAKLGAEIKRDYQETWKTLTFDSADLLIERLNIRIAEKMDAQEVAV